MGAIQRFSLLNFEENGTATQEEKEKRYLKLRFSLTKLSAITEFYLFSRMLALGQDVYSIKHLLAAYE